MESKDVAVHFWKEKTDSDNFSFSILESDDDFGSGFSMYVPTNLCDDNDIYLMMQWTEMEGSDITYTVQYGTDTDFTPGTYVEQKGLTDTKLYNPVDFIKGELYYWRVYGLNRFSNDS